MNRKSITKVTLCLLILACMFSSISFVFAAPASLSLSPPSGCVGTPVIISGTNFGNQKTVTITYESIQKKADTNANGEFSLEMTVPKTIPGEYKVTASTASKYAEAWFTVTKTPTALTLHFTPTTVGLTDTITAGGRLTNSFEDTGVSGNVEILYYRLGSTPHELHSFITLQAGNNGWYRTESPITLPPNTHLGDYIIVAQYAGNDNYLPSAVEAGPQLTVVPEYLFGGLVAMAACFGAFIVVKKRSSLSRAY